MSTPHPTRSPVPTRPMRGDGNAQPDAIEVANMLDTLAAADRELAGELDRISASRSPVSDATVTALERLLTTLRPAAAVRARLVEVDRRVLAAAVRIRSARRELRLVHGGDAR